MIIKGVTIGVPTLDEDGDQVLAMKHLGCSIDVPESSLRLLIEDVVTDMMTRPKPSTPAICPDCHSRLCVCALKPPTPEERSCETCKHVVGETAEEPCRTCITNTLPPMNQWEPKPQAHEDALARARRLSECSVKDEVIAYYESAIAEEQARTKLQREIGESRLDENKELRRCLEKAEARYGVAEADRNCEIEHREEAERKLEDSFSAVDMYSFAVFCIANPTLSTVKHWLAARREERKKNTLQ
jgi:hypothetical protein